MKYKTNYLIRFEFLLFNQNFYFSRFPKQRDKLEAVLTFCNYLSGVWDKKILSFNLKDSNLESFLSTPTVGAGKVYLRRLVPPFYNYSTKISWSLELRQVSTDSRNLNRPASLKTFLTVGSAELRKLVKSCIRGTTMKCKENPNQSYWNLRFTQTKPREQGWGKDKKSWAAAPIRKKVKNLCT